MHINYIKLYNLLSLQLLSVDNWRERSSAPETFGRGSADECPLTVELMVHDLKLLVMSANVHSGV